MCETFLLTICKLTLCDSDGYGYFTKVNVIASSPDVVINVAPRPPQDANYARALNISLAFFVHDAFSLMDRGFVFSLIKTYLKKVSSCLIPQALVPGLIACSLHGIPYYYSGFILREKFVQISRMCCCA